MRIAVLGSGRMGGTLGGLWADLGHEVTFAYSRSPARLARRAAAHGARAASVAEAVAGADAVLLAVHWSRIDDVLAQAGTLDGKLVLNCCVPLDDRDETLVLGTVTSGAETLARLRPGARWVSCFNTTPSEVLPVVFATRDRTGSRPQVLTCADDSKAEALAQPLVRELGFEPVSAGSLRAARFIEPFAMVTAILAYERPGGPELTYRFERHS
ncbi:NAD(P)-binding domain-containing protein [Frigidibacter sp. MR17.14]|uniref:NADPH-dependent F420 reductase n=1 Tax=Frigidibacter sp. MR17.14 TaxID=3126509 RepID=UPI00301307C1